MEQQHAQLETRQAAQLGRLEVATDAEVQQAAPAREILAIVNGAKKAKDLPWKFASFPTTPRPV